MHKVIQGVEINVCATTPSNGNNAPTICRNEYLNNVIGLSYSVAHSICKKDPMPTAAWLNPFIAAIYALTADRDDMIDYNLENLAKAKTLRNQNMNSGIYSNVPCPAGTNEINLGSDSQPINQDGDHVEILHVCKEISETITVESIQDTYAAAQIKTIQHTGVILPVGALSTIGLSYLATPTVLFKVLIPFIGLRSAEAIAFTGAATAALGTAAAIIGVGVLTAEIALINRVIKLGKTRKVIDQALSGELEKEFKKAHRKVVRKFGCSQRSSKKLRRCEQKNINDKLSLPGTTSLSSQFSVSEFITEEGFRTYIQEITLNRSILNIERKRNGKGKILTINQLIRKVKRFKRI
jgi:hypothetical protein